MDNIKRESFDAINKELRDVLRGRSGIYALYKKGTVVKVGLGTNIYWRIKGHSKSKKMHWDTVSLFIIRKNRYLRDVETAVNRIAKPKYSYQKGRVGDEHYFKRILKKRVNDKKKLLRNEQYKKDKEIKELKRNIMKIESAMKKR